MIILQSAMEKSQLYHVDEFGIKKLQLWNIRLCFFSRFCIFKRCFRLCDFFS